MVLFVIQAEPHTVCDMVPLSYVCCVRTHCRCLLAAPRPPSLPRPTPPHPALSHARGQVPGRSGRPLKEILADASAKAVALATGRPATQPLELEQLPNSHQVRGTGGG